MAASEPEFDGDMWPRRGLKLSESRLHIQLTPRHVASATRRNYIVSHRNRVYAVGGYRNTGRRRQLIPSGERYRDGYLGYSHSHADKLDIRQTASGRPRNDPKQKVIQILVFVRRPGPILAPTPQCLRLYTKTEEGLTLVPSLDVLTWKQIAGPQSRR